MKILVTGATGFIGQALLRKLPPEVTEIRVLSRDPERTKLGAFVWDAENEVAPATALGGIDVVIHLAGENVGAGRWNDETKRRILASRERGTRNLVEGLNRLPRPPVLISTSAVGFYGNAGDALLTEDRPAGQGFLAHVCEVWEAEARKANVARLVIPRLGVVLGPGGGAIAKLLPVFKSGLGGRIGDGEQWMSWIHIDDVVAFLLRAIRDEEMKGIYNLVAPTPVKNAEFAETLGHVLHRPSLLPVPAAVLKLALGEMAEETLLASQRVSAAKLLREDFTFAWLELEGALRQITAP
jgi:uncharacterized protein (TIGR01777 family)